MKITKTVSHTINMGNYENLKLSATVEHEVPVSIKIETGLDRIKIETVLDQLDQTISDALSDDLKQAERLALESSYIQDWRG